MIPLSFAQRRLWFLTQLEEANPSYNLPFPVRLGADLNIEALGLALRDGWERSEPLRTVFAVAEGEPYQRILEPAELDWDLEVRQVPADRLAATVDETAWYAFDLSAEIPIRASLFQTPEGENLLVLV